MIGINICCLDLAFIIYEATDHRCPLAGCSILCMLFCRGPDSSQLGIDYCVLNPNTRSPGRAKTRLIELLPVLAEWHPAPSARHHPPVEVPVFH